MAVASISGRKSRSSRLKSTKKTKQKAETKDDDGDGDGATAKVPDVEELRKRRLAYHTVPADQRRRLSSTVLGVKTKSKAKSKNASVAAATKSMSTEHRRKHRRHKSSADKLDGQNKDNVRDGPRARDYVYTATGSQQDFAASVNRPSSSSRHPRRTTLEPKQDFTNVTEDEVTPDDSISQVGQDAASRNSATSETTSPTPRRSTATPKLTTIQEHGAPLRSSTASSRTPHKRQSSIFGSLLQRKQSQSIPPPPPRLVECLTCGSDDVPASRTAKLACGHRMCNECLKRVFEMSVKDPAHMPPRCCTTRHIPLKHVDKLFDLKFKLLWNRKYEEYNTKHRVYCPVPKCGEWIKPFHIHTHKGRKYAQCPRCSTKVCTSCNSKMHKSSDCPKDPEILKLVEQAKEEGWQSCYSCKAMIELKEGCNHMTCRCTAEFCMKCGSKWKTCECPWFNYRNLPDPDRLTEMRVPEPVQIMVRRVFDAAGVPPPAMQDERPRERERAGGWGYWGASTLRQPTYNEELDQRRRQERLDADLARRMQLASLLEPDDDSTNGDRDRRRDTEVEAWGLGNEAGHLMNDDFVHNAANVVMSAFGDAGMGRRGERASGRRRRARNQEPEEDAGLAPHFLGDESVLGAGVESGGRRR